MGGGGKREIELVRFRPSERELLVKNIYFRPDYRSAPLFRCTGKTSFDEGCSGSSASFIRCQPKLWGASLVGG